ISDLLPSADVVDCPPGQAVAPVIESYPAREAALPGGLVVRRALPRAGRRMVGPWCFLKRAVGAGAPELKPIANQFYGDRSGQLQDPFGQFWWVTTHKEDVAPEEM